MDPRLPGIAAIDDALQRSLETRANAMAGASEGRRWVNRLARETSPYLLQHAHNPVNWFAWGDEAFARAGRENKLVLISIGYSTCHWCHVMEHESFEDEEIAAFINAHYIPIKVDREERPDVDAIYMTAVQMISGHGGWPMTVFALADQRPIYAGTYFPARDGDRGARLGFLSLLREIERRYREAPDDFAKHAAAIVKQLQPVPREVHPVPGREVIDGLTRQLAAQFDPTFGGFGGAPKFPRPAQLDALMRAWARTGDAHVATMVSTTLTQMAAGGMHDHVGGGFHRYSVDAFWVVPHFEKMLYDNAQLAVAYLEAGVAFERDDFLAVARRTLDSLLREMRDPAGGFYSATDADSRAPDGHMEEGWFFTWTPAELEAVLGEAAARRVALVYGVSADGNFEGRTVLHLRRPLAEVARELGVSEGALADELTTAKTRLYEARSRRSAPLRDDKVIAAWNGLAISAFALAGFALKVPAYIDAARAAACFVRDSMMVDGRLLRTWRAGEARHAAVLDDYAFVIAGLLDLFEATGEGEWLTLARALQAQLDARFGDATAGGYFLTASDGETLIARYKPDYDGAEPAGNSVAFLNLLRLEQLTDEVGYRLLAEQGLSAFAFNLSRGAITVPKMICALDWLLGTPMQIVVVGDELSGGALTDVLRRRFLPMSVRVIAGDATGELGLLEGRVPATRAAAYVCRDGVCDVPSQSPEALRLRVAERDSARRP